MKLPWKQAPGLGEGCSSVSGSCLAATAEDHGTGAGGTGSLLHSWPLLSVLSVVPALSPSEIPYSLPHAYLRRPEPSRTQERDESLQSAPPITTPHPSELLQSGLLDLLENVLPAKAPSSKYDSDGSWVPTPRSCLFLPSFSH